MTEKYYHVLFNIMIGLSILALILVVIYVLKSNTPPVDDYIADLQEQVDVLTDRVEILENNQPEFDIIY